MAFRTMAVKLGDKEYTASEPSALHLTLIEQARKLTDEKMRVEAYSTLPSLIVYEGVKRNHPEITVEALMRDAPLRDIAEAFSALLKLSGLEVAKEGEAKGA